MLLCHSHSHRQWFIQHPHWLAQVIALPKWMGPGVFFFFLFRQSINLIELIDENGKRLTYAMKLKGENRFTCIFPHFPFIFYTEFGERRPSFVRMWLKVCLTQKPLTAGYWARIGRIRCPIWMSTIHIHSQKVDEIKFNTPEKCNHVIHSYIRFAQS